MKKVPVSSFLVTGKRPKEGGLLSSMDSDVLDTFFQRRGITDEEIENTPIEKLNPEERQKILRDLGLDGPLVNESY